MNVDMWCLGYEEPASGVKQAYFAILETGKLKKYKACSGHLLILDFWKMNYLQNKSLFIWLLQ